MSGRNIGQSTFRDELMILINKYSKENDSNTPDFILAQYLSDCFEAFNKALKKRDMWYDEIKGQYNEVDEFSKESNGSMSRA